MNNLFMKLNIIYIALFFQLILISYTFPLTEILSSTPLFYVDNGFHWYYLKVINNLSGMGALAGYDPYFNAGTPEGIASDVSGHVAQLFAALFKGIITEIQAWKIYVFFVALVGPILPGISLKILNFRIPHIIAGLVLSILIWWISWFHWFHVVGMVSYVFSSFLAVLVMALFIHYRTTATYLNIVIMSIWGGILVFIHPLAIIPVVVFLGCFFIFNYREIQKKQIFFFLASLIGGIALNLWWLIIFFSPGYGASFNMISYQAEVNPDNIYLELLGFWKYHAHGSKVYPLLFLLSVIAIFRTSPNQRRLYIWPFLAAWLLLELYAALAGLIPILARLTQPNRFSPAGYLLLIVPSVLALQSFAFASKETLSSKRILLSSSYLLATFLTAINITELFREVSYGSHGHYAATPPYVRGTGSYSHFVLDTLAKETDSSARILFETSLGRIHDNAHLAGYYAYTSDREFIGGPYPYSFFAGFWDGFVFGSPIEKIPPQKFVEYLKLYNIGWIMAHSNKSKAYLKQFPNIIPGASHREVQFYKVNEKHDFFAKGSGLVKERKHNLIHLTDLSGDTIELKYHYFDGMSESANTKIEPVFMMDDPTPFIRIVNPPKTVTLSLKR